MTAERRVLVADDEPLARERLLSLLARHVGYRVVAECSNGDEALASIERDRPDIAFLDISMPGRNGVDVARALLEHERAPAIVFVTAHDQYALQAFEVSAVDYLVKPVDRERFEQMLQRFEKRHGSAPARLGDDVLALLEELRPDPSWRKRFVVRTTRGHYFVRTSDVESAAAEGNYVALSAGGRTHLVRETMKTFMASVDPAQFVRIHRSTAVNVDAISRIEPLGHGEYRVVLASGARFDSSRAHGDEVQALLK